MNDERLLIVVGQNAWIFVGLVRREADEVVIRDARNIRRWGTTGGLGQLALSGPTADTVLDQYGTARILVINVIVSLECAPEAWQKLYKGSL